jgi:hyperosmotically inducible protein
MKLKLAATCLVVGAALAPMATYAADSDADRNKPGTFVKDSVITTKIKTKLAADHPTSMKNIKVDTDKDGIVWMSGTANSQQEIDQAIAIAQKTDGVKSVKSDLKVDCARTRTRYSKAPIRHHLASTWLAHRATP